MTPLRSSYSTRVMAKRSAESVSEDGAVKVVAVDESPVAGSDLEFSDLFLR